uniref:Fatty acid binding protein 5 n=1 Tax=Sarcophilus harrisii TaxID=9305 RepID=A0A7N4NG09_SARHA
MNKCLFSTFHCSPKKCLLGLLDGLQTNILEIFSWNPHHTINMVSSLLFSPEFTMAFPTQLLGKWRLVESKGFDEYMKEVGVGMALRKMAGMAKPDVFISENGGVITIKTESTIKTTQFSFKLGEKFEETTADGRKTQTLCTLDNNTLVQHQAWDGKESTITRKVEDGKLLVDCVMNNVTCHRVYEKAE